jgi:hypothetical protein
MLRLGIEHAVKVASVTTEHAVTATRRHRVDPNAA